MSQKKNQVKSKGSIGSALRKRLKNQLDKERQAIWKAAVKEAAGGQCFWCKYIKGDDRPGTGQVEHHIIGRGNLSVKYYPPNGVELCNGHHFYGAHLKERCHLLDEMLLHIRGEAWHKDLIEKSKVRKFIFM